MDVKILERLKKLKAIRDNVASSPNEKKIAGDKISHICKIHGIDETQYNSNRVRIKLKFDTSGMDAFREAVNRNNQKFKSSFYGDHEDIEFNFADDFWDNLKAYAEKMQNKSKPCECPACKLKNHISLTSEDCSTLINHIYIKFNETFGTLLHGDDGANPVSVRMKLISTILNYHQAEYSFAKDLLGQSIILQYQELFDRGGNLAMDLECFFKYKQ